MSSRLAPAAFLIVLWTAILGTLALGFAAPQAFAKDGSGGGGSGGGSGSGGGGGGSGGGSGGSGSGSGHGGASGSSGASGQSGSGNNGSAGRGAEAGSGRSRGGDDASSANHGLGGNIGGAQAHQSEAADDDPANRDQDRARDAVLRGAALPLTSVLPTVQAAVQGDVLDVKLRHLVSGTLVYDITVLSSDGRYRAIVVDARHNRILGMRQH